MRPRSWPRCGDRGPSAGAPEKRAGVMIDASSGPATSIEREGVAGAGVRRLGRSLVAIVAAVAMVVGPIPVVQAQTSQQTGEFSAAGKDGGAFAKYREGGGGPHTGQEVTGAGSGQLAEREK